MSEARTVHQVSRVCFPLPPAAPANPDHLDSCGFLSGQFIPSITVMPSITGIFYNIAQEFSVLAICREALRPLIPSPLCPG